LQQPKSRTRSRHRIYAKRNLT